MDELNRKKQELRKLLKGFQPGIIAVSGGLDSSVLAILIKLWGLDFKGVFFTGIHITEFEKEWTKGFFKKIGFEFRELPVNLLEIHEIRYNTEQRCYYCKRSLFGLAKDIFKGCSIIEGSHLDDEKKYRPGMRALDEMGILSPYRLAGITRRDIEGLTIELDIEIGDFPSRPCLLTRFPYNFLITKDMLLKIGRLEYFVFKKGIRNFRVRWVDEGIVLQIEENEKSKINKKTYYDIIDFFNKKGIDNFKIEFLKELSGFFDKNIGGGKNE